MRAKGYSCRLVRHTGLAVVAVYFTFMTLALVTYFGVRHCYNKAHSKHSNPPSRTEQLVLKAVFPV